MSSPPGLTNFKALSFDCFGTIIDDNAGIIRTLEQLLAQNKGQAKSDPRDLLPRIRAIMFDVEHRNPTLPFNEVLVETISQLAKENDIPITDSFAEPFGNLAGTWGPFPDSIDALTRLKKYYPKLVILSNIDNISIRATVDQRLTPIRFEGVYTAQDIGSYKPSLQNFEYMAGHMRKELSVDCDKGEVLHVAHSLFADHVPCKKLGLRSVWITRGEDEASATDNVGGRDKVGYEWKFETLRDFADEVERQFREAQNKE